LPSWRILLRHVLTNVSLQTFVFSMSDIVLTLLMIVTLGLLGLGAPPLTPDWGAMIQEGQQLILTSRKEVAMFAATAGTSPCRYPDRCPSMVAAGPRDTSRSAARVHMASRSTGAVA
jgi:hypothetical protein